MSFTGDAVGAGQKSLNPAACNGSLHPRILNGWRFRTPSFAGWQTWYGNLTHTGAMPYSYQQIVPGYDEILLPGKCQGVAVDYRGNMSAGEDGTPYDPQLLIKTGSCREPPRYPDADPVRCADIPFHQNAGAYYADLCMADSLGADGGGEAGGFVSSFHGETQIRAAIPADSFFLNGTTVLWDPRVLGGPMYMMSLAMVQEYLNVNMRFLQSVAGKETMFGYVQVGREAEGSISEWQRYNRDDDRIFSPWEVESLTFGKVLQAYPGFFPRYGPCAAAFATGVHLALSCVDGDWSNAAAFYMRTPGLSPTRTGPNSPQLANAALVSALTFYWLYDASIQATDLCFTELISGAKDRRLAIAALIQGYNRGPNSGFDSSLRSLALLNDPAASEKFDGVNGYRTNVFAQLDAFESSSRGSRTCGGKSGIYDAAISFPEIQRFFFGGGDIPGTPEAQGDGGLLLHFDLSAEQRRLVLADLRCAFDRLKGRAPSASGQDAISYRYDWLTLLRAVKARLPLRRKLPVQGEFKDWVDFRSQGPTMCGGVAKDTVYPDLAIISPAQGAAVDSLFSVKVEAADSAKGVSVEWSMDKSWETWNPTELSAVGKYSFRPSCNQPGYPRAGESGDLWVRATDGCGNSTIQKLAFRVDAGPACKTLQPAMAAPTAKPPSRVFSGTLNVSLSTSDSGATIFYTLDGMPPVEMEIGSTRQYRGPIGLSATTRIRAIAVKSGFTASAGMSEDYSLAPEAERPVHATGSRVRLRVTFPNGSASAPVAGEDAQAGPALFIPIDMRGAPLPGNRAGKCGSCLAGGNGIAAGPVIHVHTRGPVDYEFKVFSNLGEFLARGSGSIEAADLLALKDGWDAADSTYDARIVWNGRTGRGQKAGSGAYILKAVFRHPSAARGGSPVTPPMQIERLIFGLLRK